MKASKDGDGTASLVTLFHCCSVLMGRMLFLTSSLNCSSFYLMPVDCVSIKENVLLRHWKVQWIRFLFVCLFYSTDSREESVLGSIPLPSYVISPVGPEDRINRKFSFKVQLQRFLAYRFFKMFICIRKAVVVNLNVVCFPILFIFFLDRFIDCLFKCDFTLFSSLWIDIHMPVTM